MYRSLNQIDKKIEKLLGNEFFNDCFYIEAGANNGLDQSNTFFIEAKYKQHGLLIEACPPVYDQLINNRNKSNIFEHCALVSDSYEAEYCDIMHSNLMSVNLSDDNDDLPVDKRQHVSNGFRFYKGSDKGEIFKVKANTLQSILDKHNITHIDLFSLDVEGVELSVLEGIDFDITYIDVLVIEIRDLPRIDNFLTNKGYKLIEKITIHDYVYRRINLFSIK